MTGRYGRSSWIPALLAGAAAATAAEVSLSLLLYSGPGLNRSLTTVLVVQAGALSVGLFLGPAPDRPDLPEAVRRRWLLALGAYAVAAAYSGVWSWSELARSAPLGQGLGLALMAALPLYAAGAVLGGLGASLSREAGGGRAALGGAALAGAMLAFGLTGPALPRALSPASLYLACLMLLSAGGLSWGGAEDRRLRVRLVAERRSHWGSVRVEDRRISAADVSARLLLEQGHVRGWASADRGNGRMWDEAVLRAWSSGREGRGRLLLVGGGASWVPGVVAREMHALSVDVVERNADMAELARLHAETGFPDEGGSARLHCGVVEDSLQDLEPAAFDLVLLDTAALAPMGGALALPRSVPPALAALLNGSGVMAAGPHRVDMAMPTGWRAERLRRSDVHGLATLEVAWPDPEQVSVWFRGPTPSWLDAVGGFTREADAEASP